MATLFRCNKTEGLWLISSGFAGRYTGSVYVAHPYNRPGSSYALDFPKNNGNPLRLKFKDFTPVGEVHTHLA